MKFSATHRAFLLAALGCLGLSGLAWALIDLAFGLGPLDQPVLQSAKVWLGRIHGGFGLLGLIAVGSVLPLHTVAGWRARAHLRTGPALIALFALLILSGYILYYAVEDSTRSMDAWLHIGAGLAAILAFALHWK